MVTGTIVPESNMSNAPARLLSGIAARLPTRPPATLLATALNVALRPRLSEVHKAMLDQRVVLIGAIDVGVECRVSWSGTRFVAHGRRTPHDVAIRARLRDFHALATHAEDPDTLFFQRRLLIEGDTALGLGIKNLLDGMEMPSWLMHLHSKFSRRESQLF